MNTVNKIKKFLKSPNIFFRDYFLKRAPINYGESIVLLPIETGGFSKKNTIPNVGKHISSNNDFWYKELYPVNFPIDVVFTWVDADDANFIKEKAVYQSKAIDKYRMKKDEIFDIARFISRDELKYALRSIELYAQWVNHIYIITNGQIPKWLNTENTKITIVRHEDILDPVYLPTFNSHVIESSIHKIKGLSEHYIYFNDDVMLTRAIEPEYFFSNSGLAKVFITNKKLPDTPVNMHDTPTQWAEKNARQLLFAQNMYNTDAIFAHTFHPQLKSINQVMEIIWNKEYHICRSNKFRHITDIFITGFLHHHYAILTGKAIAAKTIYIYFNIRNPLSEMIYKSILARKNTDLAPYSICLNDHKFNKKLIFVDYEKKLTNFLEKYFPYPSIFEL
jgi:hypothetical protein